MVKSAPPHFLRYFAFFNNSYLAVRICRRKAPSIVGFLFLLLHLPDGSHSAVHLPPCLLLLPRLLLRCRCNRCLTSRQKSELHWLACALVRGFEKLNQDFFTPCPLLQCIARCFEGDCILLVNILGIEVTPTLPRLHWVRVIKSDLNQR